MTDGDMTADMTTDVTMASEVAIDSGIDSDIDSDIDKVTVMLVDDHAIVRQGLRAILEREDDLTVVAEAATPGEAVDRAAEHRPDVVVVDLKLSASADLEGLSLCGELTGSNPDCAVLVLTTFLDDQLVRQAIEAGARGYIVKDVDTTELVSGIRAVHAGGSVFDSGSAAAIVRTMTDSTGDQQRASLTERELEVLRKMATGHSNRAIGEALYISENTAKFHVGNIIHKLGVNSRAQAVYVATKDGLL